MNKTDEKVDNTPEKWNIMKGKSEGSQERITKLNIHTIVTIVTRAITMTILIIEVKFGSMLPKNGRHSPLPNSNFYKLCKLVSGRIMPIR